MPFQKVRQRIIKQRKFRLLLAVLVVLAIVMGVIITPLEKSSGNIKTFEDGIWWAVTTVTTGGFGDYFPVTFWGRWVGFVLSAMGVVLFGLVIAIIGSSMNRSQEEYYWNRIFDRIDSLEREVLEVRRQTGYMVRSNEDGSVDGGQSPTNEHDPAELRKK